MLHRGLSMLVSASLLCFGTACGRSPQFPPDDAKAAGLTAADFPQAAADVFKEMDGGIPLSGDEIKGRNTWILWTAGNQVFWDRLAREGYGIVDLLKTLDSRRRPNRFAEMGLVNEPGLRMAEKPDEFGLWLDERVESAPPGIDEKIHGRSSGVLGFRIYPNPDFDAKARKNWKPDLYYSDPRYSADPKLIRPYRVGVTCGLCHVGPHPLNPPADPENPRWENLASAVGNQYFREGKVFATGSQPGSFLWEMLNAQPPGTSDTSRAATDHINNPSAINAIFGLEARFAAAVPEKMAGGELRRVPHILKDGADSIGVVGAVMRVYVSEGLYSQQWLTDHDLLLGLRPQRPFRVGEASKNSVYWQATSDRVGNLGRFFARLKPMRLEAAPGGPAHITTDEATMRRGKIVFADTCALCHSSKQPPPWVESGSDEATQWYRASVARPDFRDDNFLSTDRRYPVSRIKTNACRALATNATAGHIWDNFSSETYKSLESVGVIETFDPLDPSTAFRFTTPGQGPGYYRVPSLISMWTSAPYLHNNSVGDFTGDPSVAGRMRAFNDAIEKLLWSERRRGAASVWTTSESSVIRIPDTFVPRLLKPLSRNGVLEIGPIPKGTPINLLANVEPRLDTLLTLIPSVNAALTEAAARRLDILSLVAGPSRDELSRKLIAALMTASKCPDLIEDRGHLFGASLPDADKRALIEFLKTL
jgi:hypothetical protein